MAKFIRHVGKHGDRKVAIVFREVPGEPHMCLVTYTELLNQNVHDPMIKCIESDIGQSSENLADALNRTFTNDGRPILQVLHMEGQLKKVNTELVVMTPQPNVKIKLSELNKILDEMKTGEEAVKKLEEMDKSLGIQSPREVVRKMRGDNWPQQLQENHSPVTPVFPNMAAASSNALDDTSLATNLRQQAVRMSNEAKGLLAEADRLLKEAANIDPTPVASVEPEVKTVTKTRKSRAKVAA
jgi:hypothetical protein